jgi:hypothetical protein
VLSMTSVRERLYVGHEAGLSIVENDLVLSDPSFAGRAVRSLTSDALQAVAIVDQQIVSLPDGVALLEPRAGETFESLHMAADGALWIASSNGLSKYRHGVRRAIDGVVPDGAQVNGLAQDAKGNLWIATSAGLVRHRPSLLAPHVRVAAAWAQGTWIDAPESLILKAGEHVLFVLEGASFALSGGTTGILFQGRMVGRETQFVNAQRNGLMAYRSLPPGRYRFEARALSADLAPTQVAWVSLIVERANASEAPRVTPTEAPVGPSDEFEQAPLPAGN